MGSPPTVRDFGRDVQYRVGGSSVTIKPPPPAPERPDQRVPPCPKCHRNDRVDEEDQSGSSSRWFLCDRCGIRYPAKR
jgi:hypothetical protein